MLGRFRSSWLQATPAFAASPPPDPEPVALTAASYQLTSGELGGSVTLMGWTGPGSSVYQGNPATGSVAVVPGTIGTIPGFLSARNVPTGETTVQTLFTYPVEANVTYGVELSVYSDGGNQRVQLVDIDLLGDGVVGGGGGSTTVGRYGGGYLPTAWPHSGYTLLSNISASGVVHDTITPTFAASANGLLTVRYVFTLKRSPETYTTDLDMWVAQPVVLPLTT